MTHPSKTVLDTGRFKVGEEHPVYFIADIAANHDGSLERAKELIYLCAESGANAAKFQNFKADTIASDLGFKALGGQKSHQAKWSKSVFEIYADATLPLDWTAELKETCDDAGIDYFTAPYDMEMLPYLSHYVAAWKLGSGDITCHDAIKKMAQDGKPLFIATGAATFAEVEAAMQVAMSHTDQLCIMQCNTNYTGSLENFRHIALNVLKTYATAFPKAVLGLSDHTPGHATTLGAVALGARAIEKHFTDDVSRKGPDHPFSMDPVSWRDMVDRSRELENALGSEEKRVMDNEKETLILQRRAIRAVRDLVAGTKLKEGDLICLRPCPLDGLPPYKMDQVMGQNLKNDLKSGDIVTLKDIG